MTDTPADAIRRFLTEVRRIRATQRGTAEQSYYPAVNRLLTRLGELTRPARWALSHPAGIEGDFPDVALYERDSNVLAAPIEVKPVNVDLGVLVASTQARRYAQSFGGGLVVVTNLREFGLARQGASGTLVLDDKVILAARPEDLDRALTVDEPTAQNLLTLIELACSLRPTLSDPHDVARFLAYHARRMRDAVANTGDADGLLAPISAALRDGLEIDLPSNLLVPTVVQTLVYGLFAAWLETDDPSHFDWMDSAYRLDVPVFADVLHAALRPALIRQSNLKQHLDAIGRLLSWVNRSEFLRKFEGGAIEYFYEPFLAEFDARLRGKLGVWYTPREIADFQVARADHYLRYELKIPDGLADPVVYVLDPACGTGTYNAAVLRRIRKTILDNGEPPEVAAARVREAATHRVFGFEILPAAFIICHLHLGRLLIQLGAQPLVDERIPVYLTNSLIGWDEDSVPTGATLFPELEEELRNAAKVKHIEPVIVVLGNPPYEGYSSAETAEERQMLAPWIEPLWPQWGLRKHRLNDLYVRFWRIAVERIANITGRGVVSFITNRKWLGGRSYPAMRQAIVEAFQLIRVDDLHGAADDATHPGDQSIFTTNIASGIKRGTAIVTAVRMGSSGSGEISPDVRRREYRGSADSKRRQLARNADSQDDSYQIVNVSRETWWRFTADREGDDPPVDDYLTFFRSGVQPVRDEAVLDVDREKLERRMKDYFDKSLTFSELVARHPGFGVTRARYHPARTRQKLLVDSHFRDKLIVPFLYRPFDVRWMYWEPQHKLLTEARRELIAYWTNVPHQRCLVLPQTPRRKGALRPVVTSAVASFDAAEPNARVFPLYRPASLLVQYGGGELDLSATSEVGLAGTLVASEWAEAARDILGLEGEIAGGEAIFYAMVTVMNAPAWIDLQPVDLDDFPQVGLPADRAALSRAVDIGRQLADLFDTTTGVSGVTTGRIRPELARLAIPDSTRGTVSLEFGSFGYSGGRRLGDDVLWSDGVGWRNVPESVWSFSACGFPVLSKWLSYRVRTGLSADDRDQFMLLVRRIARIRELEPDCDNVYQAVQANPLNATAKVSE